MQECKYASMLLVLTQSKEQVQEREVREYLPTRRKIPGKRTGRLGLTTENSVNAVPNDQTQWKWPSKKMTEGARKKIFALVVEQLIKLFCESQTYTWRGQIYLQLVGLPIGPRATSAIARVVMNYFDMLLSRSLARLRIEILILARYVDDIRALLERIRRGMVLKNGSLVYVQEQKELDDKLVDPDTEVTARVLRQVMNEIMEGIVFTSETRLDFIGDWGLPTLDTSWKTMENGGGRRLVGYKFFKKPISSKFVTPFHSAQTLNGKIASLSQDIFRMQSNGNFAVTKEERIELVESFCDRLRWSGYPWKVATRIVRSGLVNYQNKVKKAEEMGLMFHRAEGEGQMLRRRMKLAGKSNWFRPECKMKSGKEGERNQEPTKERWKNGANTGKEDGKDITKVTSNTARKPEDVHVADPLFVQATEGGNLASLLRVEEEKL